MRKLQRVAAHWDELPEHRKAMIALKVLADTSPLVRLAVVLVHLFLAGLPAAVAFFHGPLFAAPALALLVLYLALHFTWKLR